jgi:predicted phage terminase large subunit-like protein
MNFQDILRARPLVAAHLKKDFAAFCRAAWPHLHPGAKLSWTVAHDLICEYMVCVFEKKLTRVIVNCPPRFAKSSIVTILFPIWCWLREPAKAFLCCSYEIDLATNHNLDRRRLMDSKWFRDLFADAFTLSTDRSQAQEFSNTSGGVMQAASTNSKAMGRGGDVVICDDPLSGDVAYSDSFRNEVNFWFEHQLPQRLNNPSESAIVVVMQRLHQNDPSGFLLSQEDSEWKLLKLPLIAEEDTTITFPISGRVWKRKKGDCLDPKRWSPRAVRERQRNRLVWSGQFQQEPSPLEGNIIRAADILYFGGRDPQTGVMDPGLPESFERKIISVDCSFKDLRTSDYVAVIVVGIVGSRRYLLHVTNAHLDLVGTMNEIRNAHATYGPVSAVLVESAANGVSVIAHLKEEIAGLVPITAKDSKMARLVAASPEFQAQNWIIERNGPWTHKTVEQLTMFPNCKNDDICDSISQASIWLQANSGEFGLLKYFESLFSGKRKMPASVDEHLAVTEAGSVIVTKDQWQEWTEHHRAPACPDCGPPPDGKIPSTTWLGSNIHCNSCGIDFTPDGNAMRRPTKIVIGVTCCPDAENVLKETGRAHAQTIGSELRCVACGKQSGHRPEDPDPGRAVSRKNHFRNLGQFALRDGPTKFPWSSSGRF